MDPPMNTVHSFSYGQVLTDDKHTIQCSFTLRSLLFNPLAGPRGGPKAAPPPSVQYLSNSFIFQQAICQIIGWRPL